MLEICDLAKRFGDTLALDGISLQVAPGEIYGFVGANGAGKSTAMRIAMGVVAPDSGTVCWNGASVDVRIRRSFGYMPEQRGLYPKMRIAEQIAYFGRLHAMTKQAAAAAATHLLESLEVKAEPTDLLQALSLGNQQRVQLACALVHDPGLLILDEPFSGLDPLGVDTMAAVLQDRAARGVAVMFSSHQLELVERLCQRIGIITNGQMIAQGTLDQLRAQAAGAELDVSVDAPDGDWLDAVPGARLVGRDGIGYRIVLEDPACDQHVLAAAAGAGRVHSFGWRQPSLSELYRAAVSG